MKKLRCVGKKNFKKLATNVTSIAAVAVLKNKILNMNERQIELPLPNDSTEPAIVGNTVLPAVASERLHRKLVEAAYRWVLNNSSCGVAFKELNTNACNGEYPDVIGFGAWGHSVLIECKTSRSDFHADKKKSFRKTPSLGMGTQRFYCCPTGLLKIEDLPEGWGLIYVNEKLKPKCVHSPYKGNIGERHNGFEKNIKAEHGLMYSALRRLHLRGRIDEIYEAPQP